MSTIERIITQRVETQIRAQLAPLQAQIAPLQAQNEAFQKEVEALKRGVAKIADKFEQIADPFSLPTFTNNMLDLLMRANAAGRAAAMEADTVKEGGDLDPPRER